MAASNRHVILEPVKPKYRPVRRNYHADNLFYEEID